MGNLLRKKNKSIINIYILAFLLLSFQLNTYSQTGGKIQGVVFDNKTGEKLIGANVILNGTTIGAATDIDGNYLIKNIPEGEYSLTVSMIGYTKTKIVNIKITNGVHKKINVSLDPATFETGEVVITADVLKNSENAVLRLQKRSGSIVDAISAELIKKNNSSDGTDVLKRMSGVTISQGKFAFIRGIGDRYNNTLLNGSELPSTDPEKKSFSYDIFPASLIESIVTSKTFTPDEPGDFSGGLVKINTIDFPAGFVFNYSTTVKYNSLTTGKAFTTYNGGKTDYLGIDNGTRALPTIITADKVVRGNYLPGQLQKIGLSFKNNWKTFSQNAPINGGLNMVIGDKIILGKGTQLGYMGSFIYSNSRETKLITQRNYTFQGLRYNYNGGNYSRKVEWSGLLNFSLKFNNTNKISFKNLYSQNTKDNSIFYEGSYKYADQYRQVTSIDFIERTLISNQVIGSHQLNFFNGLKINWNISYATSKRNEPDRRRYVYARDIFNPTEPLRFLLDQAIATRYFGKLKDHIFNFNTDFTFKLFNSPTMPNFKAGLSYNKKDRNFKARIFGFKNDFGGNFLREDSILKKSVTDIFQPKNFNNKFIQVTETTRPSDSYTANQKIYSAYLMFDVTIFSNLRIIAGTRYEQSNQNLKSKTITNEDLIINRTYRDLLPSINLTYHYNNDINLRFGYSRTLARPEFREMAPFSYFDFTTNELVQGNNKLVRSLIQNYDFRFEFYPAPKELIAVSFFYKNFQAPIEEILIASSSFEPIRSFENGNDAKNYGIELELKKSLNFIAPFLNNFFFVGNTSFINSNIEIGKKNGFQRNSRPMQGQANYIMNFGLYYDAYATGFSSSITYNKVGKRISRVGFSGLGDIVEMPRDQIDINITKKIFKHFNLRLAIRDLLNQDRIFIQKTPLGDKVSERQKLGRNISLALSYQL